ncbi:MAG: peptidylprolyl isomerase [Firmicutes bacterium]|nr:peptidylprolyl isomerase [Bacillota bacterium]
MKKIMYVVTAALAASMALSSCGVASDDASSKSADATSSSKINKSADATSSPKISKELKELTQNTVEATIVLENGDEINLELYPDLAPDTVENFVELADEGFYDGTIFHRVIEGFMIQGGGYDEDLNSLKADTIDGEFTSNGFENDLSHTRGVISMARTQDPDSASSQFFIVQEDSTYLDGEYAAFGKVTDEESLEVVDDIASVKTGTVSSAGLEDVPVTPVVIKTVKIKTGSSSILDDDDDKTSKSSAKDDDDDKTSSKSSVKDDDDDDNKTTKDKSSDSKASAEPSAASL